MSAHAIEPRGLTELSHAEHLILWALRTIAVGRGDCPLLMKTFVRTCGPEGQSAFVSLFTLVKHIGYRSRRRLRVHSPGCASMSLDEEAVLAVFAAAQDSLRSGLDDRLSAHFTWLVEGGPSSATLALAKQVATILAGAKLHLPMRAGSGAAERPAAGVAVVVSLH